MGSLESSNRQWYGLNEDGEIVPIELGKTEPSKPLSDNPDIDAQLQGQKIQNEQGLEDLNDDARDLLG
jgi:hypothetical protein